MARQIIITLPDEAFVTADADYVHAVAAQIEEGYLSGHVDRDHHWTTERDSAPAGLPCLNCSYLAIDERDLTEHRVLNNCNVGSRS